MSYGVRTFDANGGVIIDTSSRLSRVLGETTVSASSITGSVSVAGFDQGTPWWACVAGGTTQGYFNITPSISRSGNTLSWDWGNLPRANCKLIFGVF